MARITLVLYASILLSGCAVATMLRGGGENDPRLTVFIQNASEHYVVIDNHVSTWLKKGQGVVERFKKKGAYSVHIRAYEVAGMDERGEVTKGPLVWEEDFPLIVDGVTRDYCGEVADTALIIMEMDDRAGDERDCFKLYIPILLIDKGMLR